MPPKKTKGPVKKSTGKTVTKKAPSASVDETRRDFIVLAASAAAAVGGAITAWPFLDSMSPAADALALATTELDISSIEPGQEVKTMWRGKPVFVRRRTQKEIEEARAVDESNLPDPQTDAERVVEGKDEWMVVIGVCTHLGCIPISQRGDYNGWFCPCHGSHYDISGRIRKGPAPENLAVPKVTFLDDTTIRIG